MELRNKTSLQTDIAHVDHISKSNDLDQSVSNQVASNSCNLCVQTWAHNVSYQDIIKLLHQNVKNRIDRNRFLRPDLDKVGEDRGQKVLLNVHDLFWYICLSSCCKTSRKCCHLKHPTLKLFPQNLGLIFCRTAVEDQNNQLSWERKYWCRQ